MAVNSLWPLIANARPADTAWQLDLCISQDANPAMANPASMPVDTGAMHLVPHCPLCSFGADQVFAPPAAALPLFSVTAAQCRQLAVDRSATLGNDVHSPAHPRAPPFLS